MKLLLLIFPISLASASAEPEKAKIEAMEKNCLASPMASRMDDISFSKLEAEASKAYREKLKLRFCVATREMVELAKARPEAFCAAGEKNSQASRMHS